MNLHKAIARHCLAEVPKEACGVIVEDKAIRCINESDTPEETFILSAEAYLQYLPHTIFHSHPRGKSGFSDHDLAVAANMELTSYVYVVEDDRLEKWTVNEGLTIYSNILKES